jgi:hypothetical protein
MEKDEPWIFIDEIKKGRVRRQLAESSPLHVKCVQALKAAPSFYYLAFLGAAVVTSSPGKMSW